jgi:hypothetical protein
MNRTATTWWWALTVVLGAWIVSGPGTVWADNTGDHVGHGMHAMDMSVPERGARPTPPPGVQYQSAGVAMLENLTDRIDREIEKAGGNERSTAGRRTMSVLGVN